ncbi:MAG: PadR family transcriptional regulator [Firmicutes bacterium]|nr:PadR family transcriptional regulator [Bacillota bacterium]
MSLPYGLLGLLTYQDSSGYDLTKMFADSLNNFWHAQSSQIYRELNRMEEKGWVTSRNVVQEGRPNKRIYSITGAGRNELDKWLADTKPPAENLHLPLLMRVFFGADSPAATLALLKECRAHCKIALEANYSDIRKNIDAYATLFQNGPDKSKYWLMTLDFGIAQIKTTLEWAERCIAQMEEMST